MAVMAREAWTDERLDDLAARMDRGFAEVKGEIRDLRSEASDRFDSMQRTMILGFVTLNASVIASVIGGVFAAVSLG
jgi:hypothetical protein